MEKKVQILLFTLSFSLFVQSFYPAYQININLSEIVENSEDSAKQGIKKVPLYHHESKIMLANIMVIHSGFEPIHFHDIVQSQCCGDIWVPPPRV